MKSFLKQAVRQARFVAFLGSNGQLVPFRNTVLVSLSRGMATEAGGVPPVTQTNRAETSMKRFWKQVDIADVDAEASLAVRLDSRPLKTPNGNKLFLPKSKRLAATLIAQEWESQEKLIKPYALPMTSLASRAIDGLRSKEQREEVVQALLKYLHTDTICYHEEQPPALVRLQAKHWHPLLDTLRKEYQMEIKIIQSLFHSGQPEETRQKLEDIVSKFDKWQLAALERSVYATKSFLVGFALVRGHLSVDQAANVSHVEVQSQIETWGQVEDSHDVDHEDIRRQLGSAACLLVDI